MTSVYKSQTDFSGGEISPRLSGRADSERYQKGLETCENFVVTPQGSLLMRDGTKYIGEASSSEDVRLVAFPRANEEDYVVEISAPVGTDPGKIRVWASDRQTALGAVQYSFLANGKFTKGFDGFDYWDISREFTHESDSFWDAKGSYLLPYALNGWSELLTLRVGNKVYECKTKIAQSIIIPAGVDEVVLSFLAKQLVKTDNVSEEHEEDRGGRTIVNYEVSVGTAEGLNDLLSDITKDGNGSSSDDYVPSGDGLGNREFTIDTTGITEVWLTIESGYSGNAAQANPIYSGISVSSVEITDPNAISGDYEIDHPWAASDLQGIQVAEETANSKLIFASGSQPPQEMILNDVGAWFFGEITFINPPPEWVVGNYPRVVEIFQSRLWFASVSDDLSRVWASEAGKFDDFTVPDPIVDSSPIDIIVATRGVINWLRGMASTLLLGTDEGEHVFTSSTGALTPSDIQVNPASNNGSAFLQAEPVGDEVLYISNERRKLRAISFTDARKNWTSVDLTFPSEHITLGKVRRIESLKNPNYQVALLLEDKTWIQCTYSRGTETVSWHRHTTNGDVLSMASTTTNDGSALWLAIKRDGKIYIEYIEAQNVYRVNMDSWVSRIANDPNGIIEDSGEYFAIGLEHLEDREVFLSEDGASAGIHTVENGRIRVSSDLVKEAIIGLQFTARAKLLPVELGDPKDSIQSAKQRRAKMILRIVDSAIPRINNILPPVRGGASIMDSKEPNLTDDIEYTVLGWGRGSSVEITQDLPYRTEIVAVFGKTKTNRV